MVKWKGVKKAQKRFSKMSAGIDRQTEQGLHDFGDYAESQIKQNAVFTRGYSTGNLRRMVHNDHLPMASFIGSPAYYSGWVEWGTRYMDAQPFFFNTLETIVPEQLGKFIMKR